MQAQFSNAAVERYQASVAALNRGDWRDAVRKAASLLDDFGEHPAVHFVAGVAALELRMIPPAITHLSRAVAMSGERPDYKVHLAKALALGGDFRRASACADSAMTAKIEDPALLETLGVVYTDAGRHDAASLAFRQVVEHVPQRAVSRFNLASALLYAGDIAEAEAEYEACLAADECQWRAYPALSSVRRQRTEQNHLEWFAKVLERHRTEPMANLYVNLALAKENEDLGLYHAAFDHYQRSNRAGRFMVPYSQHDDDALFAAISRLFSRSPAEPAGYQSDEPIFVVGMPRSGTTLVERILGAHSTVTSVGELHNFPLAVKRLSGSRTAALIDTDTLASTRRWDWSTLGRSYIDSTRQLTGGKPRFVDKLPHNFLYLGHILHALPRASVICLRRDPMDTCLGNFRQIFSPSSPFTRYSFDLLDIGHYYLLFDRLMMRWKMLFPGRILEVEYEALVQHQADATGAVLKHCGLAWEDACLHFEDSDAPSTTASVVQVRDAMHSRYVGRWHRYEQQLAPLAALLVGAGCRFR